MAARAVIPSRLRWAVESLSIRPSQHVLEIGCGTGVAAALVCAQRETGTLLAIDRSATAITAARARNRAYVRAGRVAFRVASLAQVELERNQFHTIFAFNVGSLRRDRSADLARLAPALRARGRLVLFEQPPSAAMVDGVVAGYRQVLDRHGFAVREVSFYELSPAPVVRVEAWLDE